MMRILCLGDSLTYGFGLSRTKIWTALAAQRTGAELLNRAVNGNTTGGMMSSFHREVEAAHPDAVLLMGGGNDIFYGGDAAGARANIGGMAHLACAVGIVPLIGVPTGPCPPIREDWASFINLEQALRLWDVYTGWLRDMCRAFGFPVVDFAGEFSARAAQRGGTRRGYFLEDGLHPNQMGHEIMAEIASEAIESLMHRK